MRFGCSEGEEASRRGLSVEMGDEEMKVASQVLKCSPVEVTPFVGRGEMWGVADMGEVLVIPPRACSVMQPSRQVDVGCQFPVGAESGVPFLCFSPFPFQALGRTLSPCAA